MVANTLGAKLRKLRKDNNYSVYKLKKILEEINIFVREKTIYKWENNTVVPDIKTINALSHIYGISLTSIYEDSNFCKSLNKNESEFIECLRNNNNFKKISMLLNTLVKGEL